MPTAFDVRALTSTVRIELDDSLSPAEQESIRNQWTDLIVEQDAPPAQVIRAGVAWGDDAGPRDKTLLIASSADELSDRIATEVTLAGIRLLSGEALMLHAAAVALDNGRVIGFIGPSGRGKTTAALALGAAFQYVTDETLAVRPDGTVVAYPKPLSIGERPAHKRPAAASSSGLVVAPAEGLRLAALVLLDRQPDVEHPRVETVGLTEALPDLVPQTSYFARIDRPLRTLVELIRSTGGVRRVVYSEASTLPGLIEEIVATTSDDDATLTDVASTSQRDCDCFGNLLPGSEGVAAAPAEAAPGTYRRGNHTDALLMDEQLLVLGPHEVTVLEGLGPVVWLAANDSSEDQLREAALSQLPEPPAGINAAAVVAGSIRELIEADLLVQS